MLIPIEGASYYCHGYRNMQPADYEALANRMWRRYFRLFLENFHLMMPDRVLLITNLMPKTHVAHIIVSGMSAELSMACMAYIGSA